MWIVGFSKEEMNVILHLFFIYFFFLQEERFLKCVFGNSNGFQRVFFIMNKICMNESLNRSYKVIAGIIVALANTSISFKGFIKTKKISSRLNCYEKRLILDTPISFFS